MIRQILEVGGNLEMAFGYFWAVNRMLDRFQTSTEPVEEADR